MAHSSLLMSAISGDASYGHRAPNYNCNLFLRKIHLQDRLCSNPFHTCKSLSTIATSSGMLVHEGAEVVMGWRRAGGGGWWRGVCGWWWHSSVKYQFSFKVSHSFKVAAADGFQKNIITNLNKYIKL